MPVCHAAHHLIGDIQNAVFITSTDERLADNSGVGGIAPVVAPTTVSAIKPIILRPGLQNCRFEFAGQALGVLLLAFARLTVTVLITGRYAHHIHQQRRELAAAPLLPPTASAPKRIAMVAVYGQ